MTDVESIKDGLPGDELPRVMTQVGDLGPCLRRERKEQGLRIDDASSLFGMSVDTLSRLENGVGSARVDKLLAALDGLGLTLLIGRKSDVADVL